MKNGDLQFRVDLFGHDRFLDCIHAADRGAVFVVAVVFITAADALQKGNFFYRLAVGGTGQNAIGGAVRGQVALELERGDNVGVDAVAPDLGLGRIKGLEPQRHDHCADPDFVFLLPVIEADSAGRADLSADAAASRLIDLEAGFWINLEFERHRLGVFYIDGLTFGDIAVEGIVDTFGALGAALAAGDTFAGIDIAGIFPDPNSEVPCLTAYVTHLGKGHDADIGMPSAFDQLRSDNAHRAVVSGENFVVLRHGPTDGPGFLHQVDQKS